MEKKGVEQKQKQKQKQKQIKKQSGLLFFGLDVFFGVWPIFLLSSKIGHFSFPLLANGS